MAQRVFYALADGAVHSGEQLAGVAGVSRSAVLQALGALQELGVAIEATPEHGFQLAAPFVPLDITVIRSLLDGPLRERIRHAEAAWSLASTNDALLAQGAPPCGQFDLQLSEHQSAGRGRRARPWFAPPGGALCFSLGWSFACCVRWPR